MCSTHGKKYCSFFSHKVAPIGVAKPAYAGILKHGIAGISGISGISWFSWFSWFGWVGWVALRAKDCCPLG